MKKIFLTAFSLFTIHMLFAQDTISPQSLDSVYIDTKVPLPRKNSGKVSVTITAEDIARNPGRSVASMINEVSGIEINGSRSNEGQNLAYFIRGGSNRQVVIMIDGVQVSDPSQIANDYDLRLIPSASIASIEIVKGASSVLYGSGAATAVINITTRKASSRPIAATFSSFLGSNKASEDETGSFAVESFENHVSVNGSPGRFFYQADFSNRYTDGLSAVAAPEGEAPFEADIFNRFSGRFLMGYRFSKNIELSRFFSFGKFKAGFDDFTYADAGHQSITEQLKTGGHFEWKYSKGSYVLNDNYIRIEREIASGFPAKFNSKSYSLDNFISHRFSRNFNGLLGFNFNSSSFNSFEIPFGETHFSQIVSEDTAKFTSVDPYANLIYISDFGLNLNAGMRLNTHSVYDTHLVYSVNPSYVFEMNTSMLKVLGSYSTAYITPSLFQLFDPLYGNENLQPEENTTVEGGLEFTTEADLRVSAVYFTRKEENFVDFITVDPELFIFQYQNTGETFEAQGVEVEFSKTFIKKLRAIANYTYTQPDERFAVRIPEHKANASLGLQLNEHFFIAADYQFNGARDDRFFNPENFMNEPVTLKAYSLFGLSTNYRINEQIQLFAEVSNIFNASYEEIYRYQTRGRNLRVGFTLNF